MADRTTKRGQGGVSSVGQAFVNAFTTARVSDDPAVQNADKFKTVRAAPRRPGVIFKRSDHPFRGIPGTQITLTREPGVTKKGWLDVPFRFMLPPIDAWSRSAAHNRQTYDVIGADDEKVLERPISGQRSRNAGAQLRTVTFRTAFMSWTPDWAIWDPDLEDPILAARELEWLSLKGVEFRLRMRNAAMYDHDDVNMLATIISCDVQEQANEPDTRYLDLGFQEVDPTELSRRSRFQKDDAGPWTHTPDENDTLYSVAERYYKSRALWVVIAQANGITNMPPSRSLRNWRKQGNKRRGIVRMDGVKQVVDGATYDTLKAASIIDTARTPALLGDNPRDPAGKTRLRVPTKPRSADDARDWALKNVSRTIKIAGR